MKIATGIIAIMLGLLVLLQSCTIGAGSSLLGDQATADAGATGIIAGFFIFVGGAFAFGLPIVSGIIFIVSALIAFGGTELFPDLQAWGIVSLALAAMALLAWRTDRRRAAASSNGAGGETASKRTAP